MIADRLSWLVVAAVLVALPARAENLLKTELQGIDGYRLMVWTNDFPPGAETYLHHHTGHEVGYILEGEVRIRAGDETKTYRQGQAVHLPAGASMVVQNASKAPAKTLVYMLAKKDAPLTVKE
jgi:quercetin dioxygenase-like cupin family protein